VALNKAREREKWVSEVEAERSKVGAERSKNEALQSERSKSEALLLSKVETLERELAQLRARQQERDK
jgi:hypothetical protein